MTYRFCTLLTLVIPVAWIVERTGWRKRLALWAYTESVPDGPEVTR